MYCVLSIFLTEHFNSKFQMVFGQISNPKQIFNMYKHRHRIMYGHLKLVVFDFLFFKFIINYLHLQNLKKNSTDRNSLLLFFPQINSVLLIAFN